jgi:hypothetical protein
MCACELQKADSLQARLLIQLKQLVVAETTG